MKEIIKDHFDLSLKTLINTKEEINKIKIISEKLVSKINSNRNIFVFGNGGSFADSAHFVGELTATYMKKRKALPFFLLNSNIASVSAWSNDFNFEDYATRELSGYAKKKDALIILSTSGGNYKKNQSINLIKLAKFAKKNKIFLISLLGKSGGEILKFSDISIVIKSNNTATIQEMHKIILHSICGYLDSRIK